MHRRLAANDLASYTGNQSSQSLPRTRRHDLENTIEQMSTVKSFGKLTLSVRSSTVIASKQTHTQAVYTLSWLAVPPFDMSRDVLFMVLYSETPLRDDTKK